MEERRSAIRWKVALPVRYFEVPNIHAEGACRTQDLSMLGARLAMVERHDVGDQLRMLLEMPGGKRGPLSIEADIVWQQRAVGLSEECNYLTGVAFRKIRDYHKAWLMDYINTTYPDEFRAHWWNGV